jgi:hypothetical protein
VATTLRIHHSLGMKTIAMWGAFPRAASASREGGPRPAKRATRPRSCALDPLHTRPPPAVGSSAQLRCTRPAQLVRGPDCAHHPPPRGELKRRLRHNSCASLPQISHWSRQPLRYSRLLNSPRSPSDTAAPTQTSRVGFGTWDLAARVNDKLLGQRNCHQRTSARYTPAHICQ